MDGYVVYIYDNYCQTSDLGLGLRVDFVFPLSQEQEEEQPSPKKINFYVTYEAEIWYVSSI